VNNLTQSKLNILVIHNYYQISGGEDTVVANEKSMLEHYGHKVILYTKSNLDINQKSLLGKISLGIKSIYNAEVYRDIQELILKEQIQIVHVHNTLSLISPSVYYAACDLGIPVFQTVHNYRLFCVNALLYRDQHICEECISGGLFHAFQHKCYHQSRLQTLLCILILKIHRFRNIYQKINYICLTEFNRQKFIEALGKHVNINHIFVKPNFIQDQFPDLPAKEFHTACDEYFLFVGRLDSSKGVIELINAWPDHAISLIICGTGPEEENIRATLKKTNQNNIMLLGKQPHDHVLQYLYHAKALIFSSQWYEGFPMILVESMMCGTPVICHNIGNAADIIRQISPETVIDITRDLPKVITAFQKEKYTVPYRNFYLQNYTEEKNHHDLMQIYNLQE